MPLRNREGHLYPHNQPIFWRWGAKISPGKRITFSSTEYNKGYVEDGRDWAGRKAFFHLDNEEINIFLISLEKVDRIGALNDHNFSLVVGEKFSEFAILDWYVIELERSIEHTHDRWHFDLLGWNLNIGEDLGQGFLCIDIEGFHARIAEIFFHLGAILLSFSLIKLFYFLNWL